MTTRYLFLSHSQLVLWRLRTDNIHVGNAGVDTANHSFVVTLFCSLLLASADMIATKLEFSFSSNPARSGIQLLTSICTRTADQHN